MNIFLTSFGSTGLEEEFTYKDNPLSRSIPFISASDEFKYTLDYSLLFLFDQLIIDSKSYEKFTDNVFTSNYGFNSIREVLILLYKEGYLILKDYDNIISTDRYLLDKINLAESADVGYWISTLKESNEIWRHTVSLLNEHDNRHVFRNIDVRSRTDTEASILAELIDSNSKSKNPGYHDLLKNYLYQLISYINYNIALSRHLNCGFYDWSDMSPFYDKKFLSVGIQNRQEEVQQAQEFTKLFLPCELSSNPINIIKALNDRRVHYLREMLSDAIKNKTKFDKDFLCKTYKDVLKIEMKKARTAKIISWITLPLGSVPFIGTPLQKAAEELSGLAFSGKYENKFEWFYLLNEHFNLLDI